jgi:hypothetical protein
MHCKTIKVMQTEENIIMCFAHNSNVQDFLMPKNYFMHKKKSINQNKVV